jgi:hypothetical protein
VLEGRGRAAKREREERLGLAYNIASLSGRSKLKPFKHYLAEMQPKKMQDASAMLAALRELQARGAPMNICRVGPSEDLDERYQQGEHDRHSGD